MSEEILIYLPESAGTKLEYRRNNGRWRGIEKSVDGDHRIELNGSAIGTEYSFRYRNSKGQIRPIMPLSGLENLRGRYFHEDSDYEWKHPPPRPGHARVCLECTLEGLLAQYGMGRHAPGELQDLLVSSVAERIAESQLPELLEQFVVDELMAPIFPSVADRTHLDPKFNYLVYEIGSIDWQLGRPKEFKHLMDRFFGCGISIVPDLIFAHAVRSPFPGSLDTIEDGGNGGRLLADEQAYLFRDYGTWMYDWNNAELCRLLVGKLIRFFREYRFPVVRVDYIDGMIYQYRDRSENAAETMLRELKAQIDRLSERLIVMGEAFSTAGNPVVQAIIDVPYRPRGFSIAEQLYRPPSQCQRKDAPDIGPIVPTLQDLENTSGAEAVYAQLHDEAWEDEHIRRGRPDVPWAYGAQPAQLALRCGRELVAAGLIGSRDLLDFTRRRVRAVEALTMFCATTRYLMIPAVDSLGLGRLDEPGRWRMTWDDPLAADMRVWLKTGIEEVDVFRLHDQHRADMVKLRRLYRELTPIDEESHAPLIRVRLLNADSEAAVLCLERAHIHGARPPVLVLFNLGLISFPAALPYQLSVPPELAGKWRVCFDGDNFEHAYLRFGERPSGYAPDQEVQTGSSDLHRNEHVLALAIGAGSLLVLEKH